MSDEIRLDRVRQDDRHLAGQRSAEPPEGRAAKARGAWAAWPHETAATGEGPASGARPSLAKILLPLAGDQVPGSARVIIDALIGPDTGPGGA